MGCSVTSLGSTVSLLLVIVSFTLPSETRALDIAIFNSVKEIYTSVKEKKTPDLSSVKKVYDSAKEKTPNLNSIYDSVKEKSPDLSSVKKIYDSVKEKAPDLSSVRDIYDSVKEKSPNLNSIYDSVKEKTPDLSSVKKIYDSAKEKRPDLSSVKELYDSVKEKTPDLSSVRDIYKTACSYGFSAVNKVDAAVRETANHYSEDEKARPVLIRVAVRLAKSAAEHVVMEVLNGVPGVVPVYQIVSQTLQDSESLRHVQRLEDHEGEIEELRARISRLEKDEGNGCTCSCRKLPDQMEMQKPEQCRV